MEIKKELEILLSQIDIKQNLYKFIKNNMDKQFIELEIESTSTLDLFNQYLITIGKNENIDNK